MAEQRQFFEKLMNGVTSRLDKLQKEIREVSAHSRTLRDVQLKLKEDVAAIRADMKDLKKVPADRSFPVKSTDEVDLTCRKFSDQRTTELVKKELRYALTNTSKDDWLRCIIEDSVVAQYHTAEAIRLLNFVQFVIRDITPTTDKAFTALVSQAKSRVYAREYRKKKKEKSSVGVPVKKPRKEAVVEQIEEEDEVVEEEEEVEEEEALEEDQVEEEQVEEDEDGQFPE